MKVLVTGGTGSIGDSVVRTLHSRGHSVRVLARHAGRDQRWWPNGVDGWAGDVAEIHRWFCDIARPVGRQ